MSTNDYFIKSNLPRILLKTMKNIEGYTRSIIDAYRVKEIYVTIRIASTILNSQRRRKNAKLILNIFELETATDKYIQLRHDSAVFAKIMLLYIVLPEY